MAASPPMGRVDNSSVYKQESQITEWQEKEASFRDSQVKANLNSLSPPATRPMVHHLLPSHQKHNCTARIETKDFDHETGERKETTATLTHARTHAEDLRVHRKAIRHVVALLMTPQLLSPPTTVFCGLYSLLRGGRSPPSSSAAEVESVKPRTDLSFLHVEFR
ncbi:hypothetical protein BHE74_00028880 [Ensete ventricosum]|nr:hypothetical protein BHE74_00028880 [Ensete ventricosum]